MDITDAALDSCHMDHLCENLHLTTDVQELNCAIAIYMDSVETSSLSSTHIRDIIKQKFKFTYHELLYPTPTTLQTQDEILLAKFPTDNWQLICDETTDRPSTDLCLINLMHLGSMYSCDGKSSVIFFLGFL